jgi:hypothetical protein
MQATTNSGSYYCNKKGAFSNVLLAVVDAEYKFMYADVGCNGRVSDRGVFSRSSFYHAMEIGIAELPLRKTFTWSTQPIPYFFVTDDAFAMRHYIMKPYPFKDQPSPNPIFSYRLSIERRILKNVYRIHMQSNKIPKAILMSEFIQHFW